MHATWTILRGMLAAGALAAAAAPPARAEERPPAPPPAPPRDVVHAAAGPHGARAVVTDASGLPKAGLLIAARANATLETPVGAGLGDYHAERAGAEVRWTQHLGSRFALLLEGGAERLHYGFSRPDELVAGTGELGGWATGVKAGAALTWSVSPAFGLTGGVQVRCHAADGADLDDGATLGVLGAVRMRLFGAANVTLGAMVSRPPEDDPYLVPVLGMSGAGGGEGESRWSVEARGPGATLWYQLSARWALGLTGGYERRDVRLAPDDRLARGVLREQRVPVGLELGWRGGRDMTLSVAAGVSVWTHLTLRDAGGGLVRSATTDPAPFVGLEFSLRL